MTACRRTRLASPLTRRRRGQVIWLRRPKSNILRLALNRTSIAGMPKFHFRGVVRPVRGLRNRRNKADDVTHVTDAPDRTSFACPLELGAAPSCRTRSPKLAAWSSSPELRLYACLQIRNRVIASPHRSPAIMSASSSARDGRVKNERKLEFPKLATMKRLAAALSFFLAASAASADPAETFVEAPGPQGPLKGTKLAPAEPNTPIVLIVPGSGSTITTATILWASKRRRIACSRKELCKEAWRACASKARHIRERRRFSRRQQRDDRGLRRRRP